MVCSGFISYYRICFLEPIWYSEVGQNDFPDGTISKDVFHFVLGVASVASGLNAEGYG